MRKMHAYDETYVAGAQRRLGALLDTAVHVLEMDMQGFYGLFVSSSVARRFACGEPGVVAGCSGEELALDVLSGASGSAMLRADRTLQMARRAQLAQTTDASPEYWTGWALAFYQWNTGLSFAEIDTLVPIERVRAMYRPFHEMDVLQFCDAMERARLEAEPKTRLQLLRIAAGLSQSKLAQATGVPVRTIQQYEQRQKDINHARADYILAFSRVLCCTAEDVLEPGVAPRAEEQIRYAVIRMGDAK